MELVFQIALGIVIGGVSLLWAVANWERVKDAAVMLGVSLACLFVVLLAVKWLDT